MAKPKYKKAPHSGKPKLGATVNAGQPKTMVNPPTYDAQKVSWQFSHLDLEHEEWGWSKLEAAECWGLFTAGHLRHIESMTWSEVKAAAGGRNNGTNSHSIATDTLPAAVQERLVDLKLDDLDAIFSLRLTGTLRIIGFQVGSAFKILWHDPNHTVCPSKKRNT